MCLVLGACGGGDGATTPAAEPGFPRTIRQSVGDVTIGERPERVVTLDFPSTDAALALGITPVGIYDVPYAEGAIQPWTEAALHGATPALLDTTDGFPFEAIAALRPDVILATNTFPYPLVADAWDTLNAIAPVVGHIEAPNADAAGHPGPQGRLDPVLPAAGFRGAPEAVHALRSADGRAQLSAERYDLLDADVVIGTSPDPAALDDLGRERVFRQVPAVARGAWVPITLDKAAALAYPSVLGIPYALDELLPEVVDAMDGDG